MGHANLQTFGWRIPFLLSAVLVGVGLSVALAAGAFISPPTVFYLVTFFGLSHATKQLGVPGETFLDAVLVAAAVGA